MSLNSERLIYRKISIDDLENFFTLDHDPEVLKYYRREPSKTLDEARTHLESYLSYSKDHPTLGAWSVFAKESGEFIGLAAFIHLDKNPLLADYELGYRLSKAQWGKGFATEIAQALIEYGQKDLNLAQIFGTTHPENVNSQKVLTKVGFELVGLGTYHGGECRVFKWTAKKAD